MPKHSLNWVPCGVLLQHWNQLFNFSRYNLSMNEWKFESHGAVIRIPPLALLLLALKSREKERNGAKKADENLGLRWIRGGGGIVPWAVFSSISGRTKQDFVLLRIFYGNEDFTE